MKSQSRGPKGQPKGTVAADPNEADEIIRKAYGKNYAGNVTDVKRNTETYLKDSKRYIKKKRPKRKG